MASILFVPFFNFFSSLPNYKRGRGNSRVMIHILCLPAWLSHNEEKAPAAATIHRGEGFHINL
jgi:hypothetical protein